MVDLRSDTVTRPTAAMREAMARAAVGDDVYGEDPTVNRLQTLAAKMLGKEAALFVPSGTMGNLAAILTHCGRGDEMIAGDQSHTFRSEAGGASALGGVHVQTVPNQADGSLSLTDLQAAIRDDDPHHPRSRLIVVENTHNRSGGSVLSAAYTRAVGELARQNGVALHLDGARIFNAAVAQRTPVSDLVAAGDSVTFCLSKGLCAPVGSVLCGSRAFIDQALRVRKQLGGGMRQAGILAAAGIVALETMVDRLAEDHDRARWLAEELARIPGLGVNTPQTNMVFLSMDPSIPLDALQVETHLAAEKILVDVIAARRIRLVTHHDVDQEGLERAMAAFNGILRRKHPVLP